MRVGLDATPLVGQRTGVGRYVAGLLTGLAETGSDVEIILTTFSARGRLPRALTMPLASRPARLRAPARLLHQVWTRTDAIPVDLLTGRVDVFHAVNFVLPPTRRAAGVVTVHDLAFLHHAETLAPAVRHYRELVPRSATRASRVITVSAAVAEELVSDLGVDAGRIVVAPHGVDDSWRTANSATPATLDRLGLPSRYMLFVGNSEPRKNLGLLLDAHTRARSDVTSVPPLVLAGPAGWGDRFGGRAPDPRHVVRVGYLDDRDLRQVVAGAVAVCMPSLYEGFGLPVLEASATGTRVLASDVPAHAELMERDLLLDPRDVDAWAVALIEASTAEDDQRARDARRRSTEPYTWRRSAETHLACYQAAMDQQ